MWWQSSAEPLHATPIAVRAFVPTPWARRLRRVLVVAYQAAGTVQTLILHRRFGSSLRPRKEGGGVGLHVFLPSNGARSRDADTDGWI